MLIEMLQSFRDKDAERVRRRQRSKRLDQPTQRAALRKLVMLDAADRSAISGFRPATAWTLKGTGRTPQHPDQRAVADLLRLD